MSFSRVALETLGCKVNQYESSYFLELLKDAGFELVSFREGADIYIVHGCAVTSRAGYQTRQLLRRARRLNPQALIVAAGCDVQVEGERIAAEHLATHILGNEEKFDLVRWLKTGADLANPCLATSDPRNFSGFTALPLTLMHSGRARAFLKIQDGCDSFCTYCIVPYTRGRSRSLPLEDVLGQVNRFVGSGYEEIVLTGIHLGQWGKDLSPEVKSSSVSPNLANLLGILAENAHPRRLRLSSIEPGEWSRELIERLASWPWICPHFHVPLQSGDREILSRMHRPYTPDLYSELIRELNLRFPEAALGADVMVGFPGETDRSFENTYKLISRLPLTYLHIFPFSPRPGTPAAALPGRIPSSEVKRGIKLLHNLNLKKKEAFRMRFLGKTVEVLAESRVGNGWWRGTSGNYLTVRFRSSRPLSAGSVARVRLVEPTEKELLGQAE
jgi:threonylcarbamoyladenosine tRNA methylthiotransferase MtaB